jgi:hypothetical protein
LHQILLSNVVSRGFINQTEFFQGRLTEERRGTIISITMLPHPLHNWPASPGQ